MTSGASSHDALSARSRLLASVIELAGRHGLHAVSQRTVEAHAGVAHGLARHYFGTFQVMLEEAVALAADQDIEAFSLTGEHSSDFAGGLLDNPEEDWSRQLLQFDLVLSAIRGVSDASATKGMYDRYIGLTGEALKSMKIDDPDEGWAAILFAALDGLTLQRALFGPSARVDRALENLRRLLDNLADDGATR